MPSAKARLHFAGLNHQPGPDRPCFIAALESSAPEYIRGSLRSRLEPRKTKWGGSRGFLPIRGIAIGYWSAERASQATSVAGAAPPVGSTWITPDSSLQNVRLPVAFTLRGTAPVT